MKINLHDLYIDPAKLCGYLLNVDHIDGRSKAKLLLSFGFTEDNIDGLSDSILRHAADNEVTMVMQTIFGDKYIVDGNMKTPLDKQLIIRSIWIREGKQEIIKFVTLYPL